LDDRARAFGRRAGRAGKTGDRRPRARRRSGRLARAWYVLGAAHWKRAQWDRMEKPFRRSLEHAERAGNRSMEFAARHFLLAAAVFGSTHADEGIRLARRMLAEAGDSRELQAWGYRAEGWLLVLQGRLDEARELLERARAIFADLGSTIFLAILAFSTGPLEL